MSLSAVLMCLLVTAIAPVRHAAGAMSASAVPFDVNRVVARASGACVAGTAAASFDSAEFMLDTTPSGYTRKTSRAPAVAFNGENYLVVWTDDSLRGIIVPPSGIPEDADGFKIVAVSGVDPSVAACSADFLVVWQQSSNIYGARISDSGSVRDPNGFVISSASGPQYSPSIASNDSLYLVAWHDGRINGRWLDIYAARVTTDRTVLDPQGIVVTACSSLVQRQVYPDVASDGTDFLIAWESNLCGGWDIRCSRVTDSGTVLDPGGVLLTKEGDDAKSASVGFDGGNYLVVWRRGPDASADIAGKRVTPGGTLLDRQPIVVSSEASLQESPDVAFDDTNYLVTWQDSRDGAYDIYCARVTPGGSVLDPEGLPTITARNDQESPALGFGTDNYLVTWLDRRNSQSKPHIYGTMIDRSGTVVGPDVVIPSPESVPFYCTQNYPVAAFDGTNYLVVWQDSQPGGSTWDIRGARVTPTGEVLDVPPIHISSDTDYQWNPAVAFGGSEYLVTWQDRRFGVNYGWAVYCARVTASGTLLDTGGILCLRGRGHNFITPTVAFDGANFLVAWNQGLTYARFVNQAGQFLDSTPFAVNSGENERKDPCVWYDGERYLVAWNRNDQIGTKRLSRFGERLDTGDVVISAGGMTRASVTSDGENFLVAWQKTSNQGILAGRIAGEGGILPPQSYEVCSGPGHVSFPSVAFDGGNYIAVWQDDRRGQWDIFGAKMNRSLTGRDTFPICTGQHYRMVPVVAHGQDSQLLVAFAGTVIISGGNPASAQRILGKLASFPGPVSPTPLWPSDSFVFYGAPVWVMVDTLRPDIDTYDFQVRFGGETLFRQSTTAPRCTIPDSVLINGGTHTWQCRGHAANGWGQFCDERHFEVNLDAPALQGPRAGSPRPALALPSVGSLGERMLAIKVVGADAATVLELFDALGRRVMHFRVARDGPVVWNLKDEAGLRVGPGSYFARFVTRQETITRKFVLTD